MACSSLRALAMSPLPSVASRFKAPIGQAWHELLRNNEALSQGRGGTQGTVSDRVREVSHLALKLVDPSLVDGWFSGSGLQRLNNPAFDFLDNLRRQELLLDTRQEPGLHDALLDAHIVAARLPMDQAAASIVMAIGNHKACCTDTALEHAGK